MRALNQMPPMFIQQQTLKPTLHAEELAFLNEVISLLGKHDVETAMSLCMGRHCDLEAKSKPEVIQYDPRTDALHMGRAA